MCVLGVCGREEWWRMKMGDGEAPGKRVRHGRPYVPLIFVL